MDCSSIDYLDDVYKTLGFLWRMLHQVSWMSCLQLDQNAKKTCQRPILRSGSSMLTLYILPQPGKTLSARRWNASFSQEGQLDIAKVLTRIQRGGVHPSIKGEVWEFLVGCFDPNSTFEERNQRRQLRRENFRCTTSSIGVQSQLSTLSEIIKAVDPKLHQHLEDLDGGEYLFAFRMLMVLFRREFSFVDALYLWELMWAMEYNLNIYSSYERSTDATDKGVASKISSKLLKRYGKFERSLAVFLVASVLETKNKQLLKEAWGLDDVVKILGDITGNLDAKKACDKALKLQKKYLSQEVIINACDHPFVKPFFCSQMARILTRLQSAGAKTSSQDVSTYRVAIYAHKILFRDFRTVASFSVETLFMQCCIYTWWIHSSSIFSFSSLLQH